MGCRDTAEEVRVLVANSELAVKRNDIEAAVKMLNSVPKESTSYAKAQMVKADVYLKHRRDKKLYAKCFEDLIETNPTSEAYIQLGKAYLRIQNYNDAVDAMQKALEMNPRDFNVGNLPS